MNPIYCMLIYCKINCFSIFKKIIEVLEDTNDGLLGVLVTFIENSYKVILFLIVILGLILFLVNFRKKTAKISEDLIKRLEKNRKYIKGVFVELNDTKEFLRYFCNGKRWKKRIIKDYNTLFSDECGSLLRIVCSDSHVKFKLHTCSKIVDIQREINDALVLINDLRNRKYKYNEPFSDTLIKLQTEARYYIKPLENLKQKIEFMNSRYIILTGSAGNGKTNLLANFVEMQINNKINCVFLDAKNIKGDVEKHFEDVLNTPENKYFKVFWIIQNLICKIFRRPLYIILDAINENEDVDFLI